MKPDLIVGKSALIVIDMQNSGGMSVEFSGIPTMSGFEDRVKNIRRVVDIAKAHSIPVIYFAEIHRANYVDFGRELDGSEGIHCVEGAKDTELDHRLIPDELDYLIVKRRYSCFFGTDLEILLRGLKVETLILTGELTDVCVHYTFVDGHQRDYYVRVLTDCVGGSTMERHEASLEAMKYLQQDALCSSATLIDKLSSKTFRLTSKG